MVERVTTLASPLWPYPKKSLATLLDACKYACIDSLISLFAKQQFSFGLAINLSTVGSSLPRSPRTTFPVSCFYHRLLGTTGLSSCLIHKDYTVLYHRW